MKSKKTGKKRVAKTVMAEKMVDEETLQAMAEEVLQGEDDDGIQNNEDDAEDPTATAGYSNFMQEIAAIEGAPRFIHHNESASATSAAPLSQLLGREKISMDDLLPPKLSSSASKAAKATKKTLLQLTAKSNKTKTLRLPAPLTTPEGDRVAREAIYVRTKQDMTKWDAVVHSGRTAETKRFPLQKPDLSLATAKTYASGFQARTPLEEQVLALLRGSDSTVAEEGGLSKREESVLAKMTLKEAEEKRRQLTRLKVLQSHQEAKLKRQNKIKSKKYRRILRKQREKEKERELKELGGEEGDAEEDTEMRDSADRDRILERATLRHRNNSKFLKLRAKMAKDKKEIDQTLQTQIAKHRELTAKPDESPQSEDESAEEEEPIAIDDNYDNFSSDFKAYWTKQHEEKLKQSAKSNKTGGSKRQIELTDDLDDMFDEVEKRSVNKRAFERPDAEEEEQEEDKKEEDQALPLVPQVVTPAIRASKPPPPKSVNPDEYVKTSKVMLPVVDDVASDHEEDDDQTVALAEAFADDDVGIDFRKEKEAILAEHKRKDVDLTLPGWGLWGGTDIKVSKRRRKRFTVRAPPAEMRLDANKGHLILAKEDAAKKHQVSSVPFPFTSVADFESSMRAPVGDSFVPRSVFKKLIKPRTVTKIGMPIEPMDREELVKRNKK